MGDGPRVRVRIRAEQQAEADVLRIKRIPVPDLIGRKGVLHPVVDHHKHMASPAAATLNSAAPEQEPITADQLIPELDAAGIRRGVVLSVAYWFGSPRFEPLEDEYAKVRAENDWTAQQVALFPDRLVAFCSFNPLRPYALEEIDRCARELHTRGLKLHFGNSRVDVLNQEHVEKVRRVFQAANALRLPIVVHVRGNTRSPYGREHAEVFLNQILPAAPDVPVQIAHLGDAGGFSDSVLAVYAEAIAAGDERARNLYFDVAAITPGVATSVENLRMAAERIRQIGPERILWGSDMVPPSLPSWQAWTSFRTTLPLTEEEFMTIARNIAPYLR